MSNAFPRTLRAIRDDSPGSEGLTLAVFAVLLGAWGAWLVFGTVRVYAVADTLRVEVDSAAHPVQTPVAGVVSSSGVTLGRQVSAGEVLLELDSTAERLQLAQEQQRLRAAKRALEAVVRALQAEEEALRSQTNVAVASDRVAAARRRAARTLADQVAREDAIVAGLRESALASGLEALKSSHEASRQRDEAVTATLEASRVAAQGKIEVRDRLVSIARLEREVVAQEGEIDGAGAALERLLFEIQRRTLRAPCSGVVADLTPTPPGVALVAGQKVATVVPEGQLRGVAQFVTATALGRVRVGQSAVVRLDAFPWAEFGTLSAQVAQVAAEPQGGRVRAELAFVDAAPRLPIKHGLTGTVEVEVERVAPLVLLLRSAGQVVATPVTPAPAPVGSAALMP